jgi:hypothetical protein
MQQPQAAQQIGSCGVRVKIGCASPPQEFPGIGSFPALIAARAASRSPSALISSCSIWLRKFRYFFRTETEQVKLSH